jgi:hypothetical protein
MLPVCLLLLAALGCGAQSSDYCGITPQHTACRHRGIGPACGRPGERGLAGREQEEVVDYHNRCLLTSLLTFPALLIYSHTLSNT